MQEAGPGEKVERLFVRRPRVVARQPGPRDLVRDGGVRAAPNGFERAGVHPLRIFAEVLLERRDEGVLDVPDRTVAARFRPDPDALGQPADQTVFPDPLQQPVVGRRRQFRRRPADRAGERVLSARFEKLGQRKRAEVRELDAADGERMLLQREVEQRTGRHDVQRRHFLPEIP